MADPSEGAPAKNGSRLTYGNVIAIAVAGVALATAWGSLQADYKALAQRVDKGEARDEDAARTMIDVRGAIIELKSDAKATRSELERQGRQLDRIENLLRGPTPTNR